MMAGMSAGVPKYVTINLNKLGEKFSDGEEVSLETLQAKRMLNLSGKQAKLPLKVADHCFTWCHACLACVKYHACARTISLEICLSTHMQSKS